MKRLLHVIRGIAICLLMLVLFMASPLLWPVYLGILVLRPGVLDWLFSYEVF